MSSVVKKLHSQGLIKPPPYVVAGTQYECIMGSEAYGVSQDQSDRDIYGWCIPPRGVVFPHTAGEIPEFGTQIQRFNQWQQHHVEQGGYSHDLSIYSVIRYFQLCLENNPNMLDSLFVPQRCILFITPVAQLVREARRDFLHRGAWHKFKGYAFSQMKKIRDESSNTRTGKRKELVEKFGYDVKFAYHVVRLMDEVQQILVEGDINLERNSEQLKSIRRGEWTLAQLQDWFAQQEKTLEATYASSKLPWGPTDGVEDRVRGVLLRVLESHYGSLAEAVTVTGVAEDKLRRIRAVLEE